MATPEGKVKAKITAILKQRGVYYFMPRGTAYGRSGIPDYDCTYYGYSFQIEAKKSGGEPTALQKLELHRHREAGGASLVIAGEEQLGELNRVLDYMESYPQMAPGWLSNNPTPEVL